MSLSEIFMNALSNTILGMGMVFAVLIVIILVIIAASKIIRSFEGKHDQEKKPQPEKKVSAPAPAPVPPAPAAADDLELVAVITAAVAASMGTSSDGFVVRSIKRAKNRKW